MKKANSNFKNLLWTLVSLLTLGFILIGVFAIGFPIANKEGTTLVTVTFKNFVDAHRDYGTTGDVYNLIVSSLFFASLASAASILVLVLGFFVKDTKFVIPGKIVDFTLLGLVIVSVILAIAGSALYFDTVIGNSKEIKPTPGPTTGLYILLIAPLALTALPLTSGNWKSKPKAKSKKK